jgi:hypothetical protein
MEPMTEGRRRPRRGTAAPRKHRAVHLDDATYARARALASQENLSFSAWIETIINEQYRSSYLSHDEEE